MKALPHAPSRLAIVVLSPQTYPVISVRLGDSLDRGITGKYLPYFSALYTVHFVQKVNFLFPGSNTKHFDLLYFTYTLYQYMLSHLSAEEKVYIT